MIYSGPPHFVPMTGNDDAVCGEHQCYVLQIGTAYYACEGGAWFVAATPTGPWVLADSIPR